MSINFLDRRGSSGDVRPAGKEVLLGRSEREPTYSLGAVARLTGLSEHVLRAWERRYAAVQPLRTPGGTRRYRESDVVRLRKLRAAVEAGYSIGEIATLADAELDRRLELAPAGSPPPAIEPILEAVARLDAATAERLLGAQLAALGGARFVRQVASPVLVELGTRWERGKLCVASEHLASSILRNLLGAVVRTTAAGARTPPIVFTTPPGERHELGALMAAVAAADAGGHPVFLGPDLPVEEVALAVQALDAAAVAVGVCRHNGGELEASIHRLRETLPDSVEIWVGGPGAAELDLPPGVAYLAEPEDLERKVALLTLRARPG
jgi:DNA-binding transcriptional MerR regulator/methylmalonyl-CoA mutase cobalamin-binding subunit